MTDQKDLTGMPETETDSRACPVCESTDTTVFLELSGVPVHCNNFYATREAARAAPRGDIHLSFCRRCGHVYNEAHDPAHSAYDETYDNSLHFSPRFQRYAEELAADLVQRYDLHGKTIIEIGCGKGEFLALLCELGGNHGIGFDPSFVPGRTVAPAARLDIVRDFYDERYADRSADMICCRHVLEHIAAPRPFLATVRRAIGARRTTAIYVEVPDVRWTLRDRAVWDIIYDHCSYFSASSLAWLFQASGFTPQRLVRAFGGQFLAIEAMPDGDGTPARWDELDEITHDVAAFANSYRSEVARWRARFDEFARAGRRAVVWGAGAKGASFLNTLGAQGKIEYIVDINPHKHGAYIAGAGQQIVGPALLRKIRPDVVIVMNPIYCDEIRQRLEELGIRAELILA
jgi:SAM-dependent methyltransferase